MSFESLAYALLGGRPYFGMALRARQGLISRHAYFLPIVQEVCRARGTNFVRILEVGSWAGTSAVSWGKALEEIGGNGSVLCVDFWKPYLDLSVDVDPIYEEMNEAAAEGKVFRLFQHNIQCCGVAKYVSYQQGSTAEVLPRLASDSFDVIFLDGSHRYEDVAFDIEQASRLISDGGIICGDDLELQRHDLPEREHRAAVASGRDYVLSEAKGCHYHPGVAEAVGEAFGPVASWEGLWAVMRRKPSWATVTLDVSNLRMPLHLLEDPDPSPRSQPVIETRASTLPERIWTLLRSGLRKARARL